MMPYVSPAARPEVKGGTRPTSFTVSGAARSSTEVAMPVRPSMSRPLKPVPRVPGAHIQTATRLPGPTPLSTCGKRFSLMRKALRKMVSL